jgi:hypothetical protein
VVGRVSQRPFAARTASNGKRRIRALGGHERWWMAHLGAFVDTTVERPNNGLKARDDNEKCKRQQTFRIHYCSQTSRSTTPHHANRGRYIPYLHPHRKQVAFSPCHTSISPNRSRRTECIHRRGKYPGRRDFDKTVVSRTFGRKTDWQEEQLSHRLSD